MKASPLLISWHNENQPIYSAHFEPHSSKGRFATAGGDNNVRLWRMERDGEQREMLASAGDDGNTLLWVPSDTHTHTPAFGEDGIDDKETWRIKHMCRSSSGAEIYDLAWSPDGVFFITGSMDNIARIYNASTGQMVRQIAEHNHYVQGVAWDPLNEYVATQSSDRSVHIYNLKTKDGQPTLNQHNKIIKMDLPARRISTSSPAPPEPSPRPHESVESASFAPASPAPSMPGTPASLALPMNPPLMSHSRRSSFGSSPSMRRSASPAPSMPLPAVRPMENSPNPYMVGISGVKNASLYANESYTSFFRRLTFAPDGSLLFTPAGQYKTSNPTNGGRNADEVINTVYIYTRAGLNRPPIAHLPGHKKPSIAVKCSPVFYTLRHGHKPTTQITIDTASADDPIPALPDPVMPSRSGANPSPMDPPPPALPIMLSPNEHSRPTSSPKPAESDTLAPTPAFALSYRVVYAVATQDAILVYDTQQQTPIVVVSNLHYATFTDVTWSNDGLTLLMSSSDGFCSTLAFSPAELGTVYTGHIPTPNHPSHHPSPSVSAVSSAHVTPTPTPTAISAPPLVAAQQPSTSSISAAASPLMNPLAQPPSPTRSNSASSNATQSSHMMMTMQSQGSAGSGGNNVITSNPTPTLGNVPSVAATQSFGPLPWTTPPQTPLGGGVSAPSSVSGSVLGKRDTSESEREDAVVPKKQRRVAPVLVERDVPGGGGKG
ncbi:MAG: hypothetical protein L6R37_006231 [Teloschistes peruensis]|nr:MAG: hypothetical protein L6R37_006231 [Teloschistes peruensis]